MKRLNITYWILTGLFAFVMLGSAIPDVLMMQMAIKGFADMGLPAYLLPFIGVAKVLGALAIVIPVHPRLREWAYAGLVIDLLGATWCIACSGIPFSQWAPMFLFIGLAFASYFVYHKRRRALAARQHSSPALQTHASARVALG